MGGLRRIEGRAGPRGPDPRRGTIPSSESSASIPATCAPRCTRRRSRARTSRIGPDPTRPSRLLALIDGDQPSGRYRAHDVRLASRGAVMTAVLARSTDRSIDRPGDGFRHRRSDSPSTPPSRPPNRPRPAASAGTTSGSWCHPVTTTRSTPGSTTSPTISTPATCSSSTPRPRFPPRIDGVLPDGESVVVHFSTELPAGLWLVEVRRPTGTATATDWCSTTRRRSRCSPVGPCRWLRRTSGSDRLWVAAVDLGEPVDRPPQSPRPSRSATATSTRDWPIENYRSVFSRDPRQRRDAQRITPVHRRRSWPTSSATASCSPRSSSTPGSRRPSSASLPTRSATPSTGPPRHW